MAETLNTPLTELLGIKYPIMLAGMGSVSNASLVAAVSNAGGIGTLGGATFEPETLRVKIREVKDLLKPGLPFGVDLLIPQVGGNARKTNHDYLHGGLPAIADIMVEEGVKLFVCAVGLPPKWLIDKLHAAGIVCMNMIGDPKHIKGALEVGMDMVCAQGTEAGGHTGNIATLPLIPQCVDACRGRTNFFGYETQVIAAGGFYDGRGLGAALCLGASGVWMGTRFIACDEAGGGPVHRRRIVEANSSDMTRIECFTGRPCRVLRTPYVKSWEKRSEELKDSLERGVVPFFEEIDAGKTKVSEFFPAVMGQIAGAIKEVKSADEIVQDVMKIALETLRSKHLLISKL